METRPFDVEMLQCKVKFQNNLETGDIPLFGHMQRTFAKSWPNIFKTVMQFGQVLHVVLHVDLSGQF